MNLSTFIWNFIQEIISHSDNNPTKFSVLSYAYFQMLYNIGTLFEKDGVESKDRVIHLKTRDEIIKSINDSSNTITKRKMLQCYLYVAHNAFLLKLYPDAKLLSMQNYGLTTPIDLDNTVVNSLQEYSQSHITEKKIELQRSMFSTKNTTGMSADYANTPFTSSNENPDRWEQLIIPRGTVKGENGLPLIDVNNPLSFRVQNFLGAEFYKNTGFSVNPTENIVNLDSKISKTWEGGLQKEIDLLLDLYKNLTDEQKMIAEFFAGSSEEVLPPPGFFICIAIQLSQKYKQSIYNDLKMYFSLAAGLFDSCVSAWYYKSTYMQARPINLIRKYYTDKKITTWTPLSSNQSSEINGSQWLPFQPFDFVTPPFPDVASGHTTFSTVAANILNWWFNNPILYDGCCITTIPNQRVLCPSLSISNKIVSLGEFIFDKGCSTIQPGTTPAKETILRFRTLQEMADAAGLSRVYGGIHTYETNRVSSELGEWVFQQTHKKLTEEFKFSSPYN
jgi:hypothetical protein